jgi:hypothetical protein
MSTAVYNQVFIQDGVFGKGFVLEKENRVDLLWDERAGGGDCVSATARDFQELTTKFGRDRFDIVMVKAKANDCHWQAGQDGVSQEFIDEFKSEEWFIHFFIYDKKTKNIIDKSQHKVLFETLESARFRYLTRFGGKCSVGLITPETYKKMFINEKTNEVSDAIMNSKLFSYSATYNLLSVIIANHGDFDIVSEYLPSLHGHYLMAYMKHYHPEMLSSGCVSIKGDTSMLSDRVINGIIKEFKENDTIHPKF